MKNTCEESVDNGYAMETEDKTTGNETERRMPVIRETYGAEKRRENGQADMEYADQQSRRRPYTTGKARETEEEVREINEKI